MYSEVKNYEVSNSLARKKKGERKRNLHTFHTYTETYNKYDKMLTGEHKWKEYMGVWCTNSFNFSVGSNFFKLTSWRRKIF